MNIVKSIPNTITCGNLICGVLGIVFTFKGRVDIAFPLMLASSVFDFFDGLAARALKAYSAVGKELDSLADMVSFGVLPSLMLFKMMQQCTFSDSIWCYVPLSLAVASSLRLAKFNVDERQHENFLGLATPASAIICGALCYFIAHDQSTFLSFWASGNVFVPVLSLVLSALLLSEIPMFSMKFSKNSDRSVNIKRICFLINSAICIAIVIVFSYNWALALLMIFIVYILMNILYLIFK